MVAPPSMAALTESVIERPHLLFIRESVTAYKRRSSGSNRCGLLEFRMFRLSLHRWSKGP